MHPATAAQQANNLAGMQDARLLAEAKWLLARQSLQSQSSARPSVSWQQISDVFRQKLADQLHRAENDASSPPRSLSNGPRKLLQGSAAQQAPKIVIITADSRATAGLRLARAGIESQWLAGLVCSDDRDLASSKDAGPISAQGDLQLHRRLMGRAAELLGLQQSEFVLAAVSCSSAAHAAHQLGASHMWLPQFANTFTRRACAIAQHVIPEPLHRRHVQKLLDLKLFSVVNKLIKLFYAS
jgi:hypothetical protein